MQGQPLRAERRVAVKITQPENIVYCQRISTQAVELPGIAEIDILPDLYGAENKQWTIIAGADQRTRVLEFTSSQISTAPQEILDKRTSFCNREPICVYPRVRPVQV